MAAFVKKLDPNHLVSVGLIGWYGASTPDRWGRPAHLYVIQTLVVPGLC